VPAGGPALAVDGDCDFAARLMPTLRLPRRRTVMLTAVVGIPLVYLAIRFRTEVAAQLRDVPAPSWPWLLLCGAAAMLFYVANGVALRAGSGLCIDLRTATAVQLAAAAANRILPAGIGAIAVNLRFLEKRGLARPAGVATVASTKVACGLVHLISIAIVAAILGDSGVTDAVTRPMRTTVSSFGAVPTLLSVAGVGFVIVAIGAHPRVRARLRGPLGAFRAHLRALAHSPKRATMLCSSLTATKITQIVALDATVRAFGGSLGLVSVAAVYLIGSAVAGAAPTAGNVGAIEPALAIGLTASGAPAAAMLAAVLVFRIIGYWMPVLPGIVALTTLRRRGDL
jgi:uncharacterized membrane protein YbhN (UPF0104 family)